VVPSPAAPSTETPPKGGARLTHPDTEPKTTAASEADPPSAKAAPGSDGEFLVMASRSLNNQWQYSKLAAAQGSAAGVKAFASKAEKECEALNRELRNIETALKLEIPAQNDGTFAKRFEELRNLKGKEFDNAYLAEMQKASALEVSQYEGLDSVSKNPRIKDYADRALPILRARGTALETLKKENAASGPHGPPPGK
jgi:putative membrane protein